MMVLSVVIDKNLHIPVSRVGTGLVHIIHSQINNLQIACDIDLNCKNQAAKAILTKTLISYSTNKFK